MLHGCQAIMEGMVRHNRRCRLLLFGLWMCLLGVAISRAPLAAAGSSWLDLGATADPATVHGGQRTTYTLTLHNSGDADALDVEIVDTLPPGFAYVAGSSQVWLNQTLVSSPEPQVVGQVLRWTGLTVPAARSASVYGMHTFVQDSCNSGYIGYQLDKVRELMGPHAFAKQLFYRISTTTIGPQGCWVDFVNACYDRDLIPVVRLQGEFGGPNWTKPPSSPPGDYSEIAQAFKRVVAGLPRREGRHLYVEVWNEPNLDIEWSGQANPVEYAQFLVHVAAAIRELGDPRIVLLNGALSPGGQYNSLLFIDAMATVPGAMDAFDVWAAHPYPGNHPPEYNIHDDTAPIYPELTIDSYLLELQRLADCGRRGVPVLLTETGYALGQSDFAFLSNAPINEGNRADYISRALHDYWGHWPEIVGVCPYELVDPHGVWGGWDWLYPNGSRHQQYDAVLSLDKTPPLAQGELELRFEVWASGTQGTHYSAFQVTSSNAGSCSLPQAAPVQVLASTATPTPTQTHTPAGTPTSTPTPSATPHCYPVLEDEGFERDDVWDLPTTAYSAGYSDAKSHGGTRSVRIGIVDKDDNFESYSSARQSFDVPPSATSVRIGYWYYPISEDTADDFQYVYLLDSEKHYLETVMRIPASNEQTWLYNTYEIMGRAGETLWIHFGVVNDGEGGISAMYVDDASVQVCGPEANPTPTVSPTKTESPSCTPSPTISSTVTPTPTTTMLAPTRQNPGLWLPLVWKEQRNQHVGGVQGLSQSGKPIVISPLAVDREMPSRPAGLSAMPLRVASSPRLSIQALALDPQRRRLIVAAGRHLLALEAVTGRTLFSYELPEPAMALAVEAASGWVYAALPDRGEIYVLGPTGRVQHHLVGMGRPADLAVGSGRLYMTDTSKRRVAVLDSRTCSIMAIRTLPAVPHALALDTHRHRLYVGQMGPGIVLALDGVTLDVLGEVTLGGLGYPLDLALDPTENRLYVAHALSPKYGAISAIDTAHMTLVATLWGNPERPLVGSDAVCIGRDGVVCLGVANGLATLNAKDLSIRDHEIVPRSAWPGTMVLDLLGDTIYMAADDGRLWSLRGSTLAEGVDYGGR